CWPRRRSMKEGCMWASPERSYATVGDPVTKPRKKLRLSRSVSTSTRSLGAVVRDAPEREESMGRHRREFLQAVGGMVGGGLGLGTLRAGGEKRDTEPAPSAAFTLLDGRPVGAAAEQLVPGRGAKLVEVWRNRLFEYSWLRAIGRKYLD